MSGADLEMIPLHRALHRPNLLWGCERALLLLTGLLCAALTAVALSWPAAALGAAIWVGGVAALRAMAKADPQMSLVYVRHVRYRDYYPAAAHPDAPGGTHRR